MLVKNKIDFKEKSIKTMIHDEGFKMTALK